MNNIEIKQSIIEALKTLPYFRQVNNAEFRVRCPFCGDSIKNLNTGHMYIHINLEDNYPAVFNCFKCNEHGVVSADVLSALEIDDIDLKSSVKQLIRTSDKMSGYSYINNSKMIFFDYTRPEIERDRKISYIENRLGVSLTDGQLSDMKVITSLADFLTHNNIKELSCNNNIAWKLENNYVGFLSYGNSHILFRDVTEKEEYSWVKYPITKESQKNRVFYSMAAAVDIFTSDKIIINLSEGVMDAISANINLGYSENNMMNIAVCGKRYDSVIRYLISIGLLGKNIVLNIFADNDEKFNEKNNHPTTLSYFKYVLKKYKYLFGEINVYFNTISKDIGVPLDKILLEKSKI